MRRFWVPLLTFVLALSLPLTAFADPNVKPAGPPAPDPCTEHIAYQVSAEGTFNMGVGTDGVCTPQPGAWDLMYQWPSGPGTSFTSVKTDAGVFVLGRDVVPDRITDNPPGDPNTLSVREYLLPNAMRVYQVLEIVEGFTPGRKDTVRIRYRVENHADSPATGEVRVMLDTELNYNDGAPFQVPGLGAVTTETDLSGPDVPDYYAAFADFQDPTHVAAGLLRSPDEIAPSRVVFGTWPKLQRSDWDFIADPTLSITNDSAVAMYFHPLTTGAKIPAGQSVEYTTRYGRASTSSDLRPPLSMTVLAPATASLSSPFTVSAFVTNVGTAPAVRAVARLYVPNGFTVSEPLFTALPDPLDVNVTQLVTWTVTPVAPELVGDQPLSVVISAENAPEKLVTRTIRVVSALEATGPYPLLGAHGFTGTAGDMAFATDLAADLVPTLSGRSNVDTGAITSVWANGEFLVGSARTILAQTGSDKTNVIAHSKGGLDARVAMWTNPDLFDSLGMLATPNGGSASADKLCSLRRLPFGGNVQSEMGACDNESNGLFDLQTGYMKDVFNKIVRDHPQHLKVVAAGDCTGDLRVNCNVGSMLADCKADSSGLSHGDSAVCVESAFARTTAYGDGLAHALSPTFDADHTAMRITRCPVTRVLAELYPLDSVDNPWLTSGGCDNQAARSAVTPDAGANTVLFGGRSTADQQAVVAAGSPTVPAVFSLDPEGGDVAQVDVHLPIGVAAIVKVTRPDGAVDSTATVTATDTFGEPGYLIQLTGLAGAKRVVTVTPDKSAQTGFTSTVLAGSLTATAAVEPGAVRHPATIRLTATGLTRPASDAATVTAAWRDGDQRRTTPLIFDAARGQFSAQFIPPAGTYVPVDVTLNADGRRRILSAGVVVPDGSGTIGALDASALIDTDADGLPNVFRIPVNITVSKAGNYQIAADLSRDGKVVVSIPGTAQLQTGSGQVVLDVPVSELLLVGMDGPFQVTSAVLTEGSQTRRIVASSDLLGTTGLLSLAGLTTEKVALSTPSATGADTDNDGLLDQLRFSGGVAVPKAGDYLVSGTLLAPSGLAVSVQQSTVSLPAGRTGLNIDFAGELIGANGDGVYSMTGLTVTEVDNPANTDRIHTVLTPNLLSARWTGGTPNAITLIEMWQAAQAGDAISPFGLYVSEANRIERLSGDLSRGDRAKAALELDKFIAKVGGSVNVDSQWKQRIVGYARALRNTI